MKNTFLLVSLFSVLFLLQGCSTSKPDADKPLTPSEELNQFVDHYFESYLKLNPLYATQIGDHRYDDQMEIGISDTYRNESLILDEIALAKMRALGCAQFTGQDLLTCETFSRDISAATDLLKSDLEYLMPFNQFDSFFSSFAEIASGSSYVSFENANDYRNFLKRMDIAPVYIDTMIANMKKGMSRGITTPQVLVDKALKQVTALLVPNYKESVFYKPALKLEKVVSNSTDRAEILAKYDDSVQHKIYPAYQRLEKFVREEYRPAARKTHGVEALSGGKRFYNALVKYHTTTDLTPDQIMNLGLSEVKRIRAEFEEVKKQFKFKGSLNSFFKTLRAHDPKLYPFHSSEEVLARYHEIHKKVMEQVPAHFRLMPKEKFEIREVEKFKAESASEAYQNGSPDGSRPGIFWVPVPDAIKYPVKDMESLFLHEAIPGHHFQISIQQELDGIPRYRRFNGNNAYVEGWALYTESLGKDLGMYTDPYQWVGRLCGEMHRAIRLVVDTGMHHKHWSRERAIQYSKANEPGDDAEIISEIERYMAIPGQALSYKLGEIKIQELKKKAKAALGSKYNDRDFHDEILKDGALPLSVLDQKVSRWISTVH